MSRKIEQQTVHVELRQRSVQRLQSSDSVRDVENISRQHGRHKDDRPEDGRFEQNNSVLRRCVFDWCSVSRVSSSAFEIHVGYPLHNKTTCVYGLYTQGVSIKQAGLVGYP